jgi:hypothetical protein
MPVTDGDFLLRDGSTLLNSAEGAGDGVLVGPCPLNGMLLMMNLPVDGTQLICQIEESDALASGYTLVANPGEMTIAVGAKTYLPRIFWTKNYLRLNVTTCTGSFGYAIFGLTQGGEPVAYA